MKHIVLLLVLANFLFAIGSLIAYAFLGWEPWKPLNEPYDARTPILWMYYGASICGTVAAVIYASENK